MKFGKKIIRRAFKVGNTKLVAEYEPATGFLAFGRKKIGGRVKRDLEFTGEGGFKTMKTLKEVFRDMNPKVITYKAGGYSPKEVYIKEKLYARELRRLGYSFRYTGSGFFEIDEREGTYRGPLNVWYRND